MDSDAASQSVWTGFSICISEFEHPVLSSACTLINLCFYHCVSVLQGQDKRAWVESVQQGSYFFDSFIVISALKMIIQTDVSARVPWPSSG